MSNAQIQAHLHDLHSKDQWKLTLSKDWDVLGPFPLHAREQHFLSPSFPVDCELYYFLSFGRSPADNLKCWNRSIMTAAGLPHMRITPLFAGPMRSYRKTEPWKSHFLKLGTPSSCCCSRRKPQVVDGRIFAEPKAGQRYNTMPSSEER